MNEDILSFRDISKHIYNRYYASKFRAFTSLRRIKLSYFGGNNMVIELPPVTLRNTGVLSSTEEALKDALYDIFNDAFYRNRFIRLYKNLSSHKTPDRGTLHNYDKKELRF